MINQFNDMMEAIQAWALVGDIAAKLVRRLHSPTLIEIMFWSAIGNRADPSLILQTLFDNITDNETAVSNIIGIELTNKIKKHVHSTPNSILPAMAGGAL